MNGKARIEDLISRVRAGDHTAREELLAKCRNYLKIVARAQVETWMRRKVDASDVVQQTLLDAHRGLEGFRGSTEEQWLAWLRKLLTNNTADVIRQYRETEKRQIGREVPLGPLAGRSESLVFIEPQDPGDSPSAQLMRREQELQMADALAQLAEDHQEVIMLRNLQRLPFDEVASRMNRSRPAVQMLWMRAVRRLQELMGDDDP